MSEFTRDWNSVTTMQELKEKQENTKKAKQLAGYAAVDMYVTSKMVVGLGTGSTAAYAVERVGKKLKSDEIKDIVCIPTSVATENQAKGLGIPLCTLNEKSRLDVAIDGADAVDPNLALVKGGGGALLREKMVEVMADKFICIVDDSKLCKGLGPSFALPVEITPFCHEHTLRTVAALPEVAGCTATLRMGKVSTGAKKDGDNIAVTGSCPPHRLHPLLSFCSIHIPLTTNFILACVYIPLRQTTATTS